MVNITNFTAPKIKGDKLEAIFERQKELMEKYHIIEATSGLLQTYDVPVDLDDAKGQARIKDFAWRCTEELMEAMDAYQHKGNNLIHLGEEIADALHFLVELVILAGFTAKDIVEGIYLRKTQDKSPAEDKLDILYKEAVTMGYGAVLFDTIMWFLIPLGMTCHCLKNKPWVRTQRVTDRKEFKERLCFAFRRFIYICVMAEINAEELFGLYFRKSDVNKFRQRSQY